MSTSKLEVGGVDNEAKSSASSSSSGPASPEDKTSPQLEEASSSSEDEGDLHRGGSQPKVVLDPRVEYSEFQVHILTWNIASTEPSLHDVESLFLPQSSCMLQDVYANTDILVVGLQEAYQSVQDAMQSAVPLVGKDPLVELFSNVLCQKGFARLMASRLLGILTMVFVKRPLLCYIRSIENCTTKTGLSGWLGNKGASSIHFSLCDVSMCFTNCHLVPHLENNPRRVLELADIFSSQTFPSTPADLMEHDVMVLFGDLNFRLEGKSHTEVLDVLSRSWGAELLSSDQLRLEQIRGEKSSSRLFNFMEMPISFPPSYKYEPGTDTYDLGPKKRAPAWCDRILWRTHERRLPRITDPDPHSLLTQQHYAIHMQPRISDHKAVSASMTVRVNLTHYIPRVVFHVMTEWAAGKAGTIAFEMVTDTEVSMWDWIGLYPENFASIDKDYAFWVYTPVKGKAVKGREYKRVLSAEQVPTEPGRYMLLYKSTQYACVLGMSPVFPIR